MKWQCRSRIIMAMILAGLLSGMPVKARDAAPPSMGFVAAIQGRGYITRNRDTLMLTGMDLLYRGDSVRLSKGAKAKISICGGRGYEIRGESIFTVSHTGLKFKRGKALKTYAVNRKACSAALDVIGAHEGKLPEMVTGDRKGALILRSRKKSGRRGVYVVRGRKQAPVIELISERLTPLKPVLSWTPVAGRASYRVIVKSGSETIWSSSPARNSCEYPAGAPPLEEGREYHVTVEAVDVNGDVLAKGDGAVSLYSREEMESLRQDESSIRAMAPESAPEQHILLGKLYEANGRLAEALSCYEKALSLDSGNAGLRERIMLLKKMIE